MCVLKHKVDQRSDVETGHLGYYLNAIEYICPSLAQCGSQSKGTEISGWTSPPFEANTIRNGTLWKKVILKSVSGRGKRYKPDEKCIVG